MWKLSSQGAALLLVVLLGTIIWIMDFSKYSVDFSNHHINIIVPIIVAFVGGYCVYNIYNKRQITGKGEMDTPMLATESMSAPSESMVVPSEPMVIPDMIESKKEGSGCMYDIEEETESGAFDKDGTLLDI